MQGRQIEESISVLHNGKIYTLERKVKNHLYGSGSIEVISIKVNHDPDQREIDVLEANFQNESNNDRSNRNELIATILENLEGGIDLFRKPFDNE